MKEKDYSIEIMRSIACFFVVVIHTSATYFLQWGEIPKNQWLFVDVFSSFARFSVPMFIMITGALILNKECSIKKTLKRIMEVLFIIMISSIFYLVIVNIILNNGNFNMKSWIILILQSDVHYHLWYLYMLIGLYLISPIISNIVNKIEKKLLDYYTLLVLFFSATLLIPDISEILLGTRIVLCLPFQGMGAYLGCFIIGYYLYKIVNIDKTGFKLSILGLVLINIITIIMTYLLTKTSGHANETFLDRNCINSILSAMFLFYIIRYIFINHNINKNIKKVFEYIGRLSLLIYIIHPCIILVYTRFVKGIIINLLNNFYLNFIIELFIVFIGSVIVSYIINILIKIIKARLKK